MEHIVQFGIAIDDNAIKQRVEAQALDQVVSKFVAEMKANLPRKYGDIDWGSVAYRAVRDFIDENKAEIIEEMKAALVEKVTRTKAYREAVGEALEG